MMHWDLVPGWARNTRYVAKMINARAETLAERPSFIPLFDHHRCIIMVSGFFEWQREAPADSYRDEWTAIRISSTLNSNRNIGPEPLQPLAALSLPKGLTHSRSLPIAAHRHSPVV